jgi:hypothetical protein
MSSRPPTASAHQNAGAFYLGRRPQRNRNAVPAARPIGEIDDSAITGLGAFGLVLYTGAQKPHGSMTAAGAAAREE